MIGIAVIMAAILIEIAGMAKTRRGKKAERG